MRASSLALVLSIGMLPACWMPSPPDGAFACNPNGKACPDGYSCIANSCWKNGHAPDMAVNAMCSDNTKDGTESDVDCGGECPACDVGKSCTVGTDCASGFCSATTSLCVATACQDGILSPGESDVDCGGTCPACVVGKMCMAGSDCASGNCDSGTHQCVSLQCQDGVQNGSETDVDCGGGVCAPCATSKKCATSTDCLSTFCAAVSKVCVASRCQDETKNGSETDVDCGGSCAGCAVNRACTIATDCATGSCIKSFCALVSGPPNWLTVASISPRYALGVATAGDGKIYAVAGDTSSSTQVSTVEAYSPNQWAAAPSYPFNDTTLCATAGLDGKIYAIAGSNGTSAVQSVSIFTVGAGWSGGPNLPLALTAMACATGSDGKIYSIAGSSSSGAQAQSFALTPGGAWAQIANFPANATGPAAARGPDGQIYVTGGIFVSGGNLTAANSTYVYAATQDHWTKLADMTANRATHALVTGADGRIYAVGGTISSASDPSCEAYTPTTDVWALCANLGTPRSYLGGAQGSDGRVYAVGGNNGSAVGTVEAYGPAFAISPTAGQVGASISLSGSNFAANATVSVHFGTLTGELLGTGVTDASGALVAPINFKIPTTTPATYKIYVIDDRSQYPVNTPLTVTP